MPNKSKCIPLRPTQNGSRTVALFKRAAKDAKAGAKKVRRACIAFEASISRGTVGRRTGTVT